MQAAAMQSSVKRTAVTRNTCSFSHWCATLIGIIMKILIIIIIMIDHKTFRSSIFSSMDS